MGTPWPLDELDTWLDELADQDGIGSAGRDPDALRTPGVVAQITGLGADTLDGLTTRVDMQLVLIVGDADQVRAQDRLVELLDAVRAYLDNPPVEALARSWRGTDADLLPALTFPYSLRFHPA